MEGNEADVIVDELKKNITVIASLLNQLPEGFRPEVGGDLITENIDHSENPIANNEENTIAADDYPQINEVSQTVRYSLC